MNFKHVQIFWSCSLETCFNYCGFP